MDRYSAILVQIREIRYFFASVTLLASNYPLLPKADNEYEFTTTLMHFDLYRKQILFNRIEIFAKKNIASH